MRADLERRGQVSELESRLGHRSSDLLDEAREVELRHLLQQVSRK